VPSWRLVRSMQPVASSERLCGCRAALSSVTAAEALSSGTLSSLVTRGLVRHQVTVQAMTPPILPSISITSGGFVARIGMSPRKPSPTPSPPVAVPPSDSSSPIPSDYEFICSVINIHATLLSRFDVTRQLLSACVSYDAALRADFEAGFKRAQLSALLLDPEISDVVREVHESATVAWLHPGDGEALLSSWERMAAEPGVGGFDSHASRFSAEEARCAPAAIFSSAPHCDSGPEDLG
jgi:hypothetical protein